MSTHYDDDDDDEDFTDESCLAYSNAREVFLKRFPGHDASAFMRHVVRWATQCGVYSSAALLEICNAPFMRDDKNHKEEMDKFSLFCDAYPPLKAKPKSRLQAYGRLSDDEMTAEALFAAMMHDRVYGLTLKDCE